MDTSTDSSLPRFIEIGDEFFARAVAELRESRALFEGGERHRALDLRKYAFRTFAEARSLYVRGVGRLDPASAVFSRVRRRCMVILAVCEVRIQDVVPRPLPGCGGYPFSPEFLMRELEGRGRKAVRRADYTRGCECALRDEALARRLVGEDGETVGDVVAGVRKAAVRDWRRFIESASNPLSGWRAEDALAGCREREQRARSTVERAIADPAPMPS